MSWRAICRWNRQASFACACWIAGASRTFSRGSSHTSARTPLRWRQYLNKRRLSNLSWRALIAQLFEAQGLANAALYWCLTATGGSIVRSLARFHLSHVVQIPWQLRASGAFVCDVLGREWLRPPAVQKLRRAYPVKSRVAAEVRARVAGCGASPAGRRLMAEYACLANCP